MQAADLLADTRFNSWLSLLTSKVASANWTDEKESEDTICALLHLPPHIQRALFAGLAGNLEQHLEEMPYPLHSALISSHVSIEGHLSLKVKCENPLPIASLHSGKLHLPAPGLVGLDIKASTSSDTGASSVALHAASIGSHASLTSLSLDRLSLLDRGVELISQHLASLSQLQRLHITNDRFYSNCLTSLAQAIRSMPDLLSFGICSIHVPLSETVANSSSRRACEHFMQALSAAPQLSSLVIGASRLPCAPSVIQGGFQCLRDLHLSVSVCKPLCFEFVPALGHLTSITLSLGASLPPSMLGSDDASQDEAGWCLPGLLGQVPCSDLLELCIQLPGEVKCRRKISQVASMLAGAVGALPKLRCLTLGGCGNFCIVRECDWGMIPTGINTLVLKGLDCDIKEPVHAMSPRLFQADAVSSVTSLRSLTLSFSVYSNCSIYYLPVILHLTQLCIKKDFQINNAEESREICCTAPFGDSTVTDSLAALSSLQRLEMADMVFFYPSRMFRGLTGLEALTLLHISYDRHKGMSCDDSWFETEEAYYDEYAGAGVVSDTDMDDICRYLADMPRLQDLQLECCFVQRQIQQLADTICDDMPQLCKLALTYDESVAKESEGASSLVSSSGTHGHCLKPLGPQPLPRCLVGALQSLRECVNEVELSQFGPP